MFPIEFVAAFLGWMIALTLVVAASFQVILLWRRSVRARYFQRKDGAMARLAQPVERFLSGAADLASTMRLLGPLRDEAERDAVAEMAGRAHHPEAIARRSRLLWRTGHVHRWAEAAFGRQADAIVQAAFAQVGTQIPRVFANARMNVLRRRRIFAVPRALALHELGRLAPAHASVFLAHALRDPSVYVRRRAVECMGENAYPESVPYLLEELRRAVEEGNDVSLRTIKSALVRFRIVDMEPFLPFFRHPTQRMRFFVIDTLREICHRAAKGGLLGGSAFSAAMRQVVLEDCARDEFADVRARAAGVIRHFQDAAAMRALHTLLQDENEYVRLHSVRACAHIFYKPLIPELLQRVTDVRWRVREAAVKGLLDLAPQGQEQLYHFFATSRDKYACEQTAEELESRGLIRNLVADLAQGRAVVLHLAVCRKLLDMGFTSMLITELSRIARPELQISFTEALQLAPPEEVMAVLREVAEPHPEGEHAGALQLLYRGPQPELAEARTV